MHKEAEFWEREEVVNRTATDQENVSRPNNSLEKPILLELLGEVAGKHVLDLGCGYGNFGLELLEAGCASYVGLESSTRMVQVGEKTFQGRSGRIVHTRIEDWDYPSEQFDLVVSRLALHYVADLGRVFRNAYRSLKPTGRIIFSILHPVITSSDKSRELSARRYDWIVDNYFRSGSRSVRLHGGFVEQFHRPLEEIYGDLQEAGFIVDHLRESKPWPENFADEALYERRSRIPLFLFLSGTKQF